LIAYLSTKIGQEMTTKTRKSRENFTPDKRLEYAKLMVEEGYSNQQVMDISGAGKTAVSRWKKQYIAEQKGEFIKGKTALDVDKRRIKSLEKQLAEAHMDITVMGVPTEMLQGANNAMENTL
jgi:transposase